MHINCTRSEACNSPDILLVLFQCYIRAASCVFNWSRTSWRSCT